LMPPVLTIYNGSASSEKGLQVALQMARAAAGDLEILIPAATENEYAQMRDAVRSMAEKTPDVKGMKLHFRRIRTDAGSAVTAVVKSGYRQPIVLPVDAFGSLESIQRLISSIHNPILLVK
jgi:hypothetical protein